MPEVYGSYDGDSQYAACEVCGESIDVFEPHPMFEETEENAVGDGVVQTRHFCSDGCLGKWKRQRETGE